MSVPALFSPNRPNDLDELAQARTLGQVAQAAAGDSVAFDALVKEHYQRVLRFQMKWCRNQADAQELAQETFFAAWQKIGSFRRESKFSTWLLGIALNLARNHCNRGPARREAELPDDDHLDALLGADTSPENHLSERQTLTALDRALARLSDGERAAIVACYYQDLSHEEAALALDLPLGTVKTHILQGRNKLKGMLPGWEPQS